nr:helix-turn-helix transcriptional regulator [Streptomyces sp. RB17]
MSRTAFTRRFTVLVGKPPMAYVRDLRLSTAARVLRETDAPLAAIARQSGYANEFSFATAFRRNYGISPGRYRTGRPPRRARRSRPPARGNAATRTFHRREIVRAINFVAGRPPDGGACRRSRHAPRSSSRSLKPPDRRVRS